jgi:hypothetical protein
MWGFARQDRTHIRFSSLQDTLRFRDLLKGPKMVDVILDVRIKYTVTAHNNTAEYERLVALNDQTTDFVQEKLVTLCFKVREDLDRADILEELVATVVRRCCTPGARVVSRNRLLFLC